MLVVRLEDAARTEESDASNHTLNDAAHVARQDATLLRHQYASRNTIVHRHHAVSADAYIGNKCQPLLPGLRGGGRWCGATSDMALRGWPMPPHPLHR